MDEIEVTGGPLRLLVPADPTVRVRMAVRADGAVDWEVGPSVVAAAARAQGEAPSVLHAMVATAKLRAAAGDGRPVGVDPDAEAAAADFACRVWELLTGEPGRDLALGVPGGPPAGASVCDFSSGGSR